MQAGMNEATADAFRSIARSHMYWGRKPLAPLMELFSGVQPRQIVLDPFCGGGTPLIAALARGARVIGSDLNPMALFLTKVLVRPINAASVLAAFDEIARDTRDDILCHYEVPCVHCGVMTHIDYIVWNGKGDETVPETIHLHGFCGRGKKPHEASPEEACRQAEIMRMRPRHWFPKTRIHSTRRPSVEYHHQLFTGRNLSCLSQILARIRKVPDEPCREALTYVFTAMLYSCSEMQQVLAGHPSSTIGWYACRFYLPALRKELNVWRVFERRLRSFLNAKRILNTLIPWVRIAPTQADFTSGDYDVFLFQGDAFKTPPTVATEARHVFLDPPYNEHIDYFAFSEFWGSWLGMAFDFNAEWHPKALKEAGLRRLLKTFHDLTRADCTVTLACAPDKATGWNEEACIADAGYVVDSSRSGPIVYDKSMKRGLKHPDATGLPRSEKCHRDVFMTLVKKEYPEAVRLISGGNSTQWTTPNAVDSIMPYMSAAAYLVPLDVTAVDEVKEQARRLMPRHLASAIHHVTEKQIRELRSNPADNRAHYCTLCGILLRIVLRKEGWAVGAIKGRCPEPAIFGKNLGTWDSVSSALLFGDAILVAERERKSIVFLFTGGDESRLTRTFGRIKRADGGRFHFLGVLVAPRATDLDRLRSVDQAQTYPRAFFTSLEEIRALAFRVAPAEYESICTETQSTIFDVREKPRNIMSFRAKILKNNPVGGRGSVHRKLTFQASEMKGVRPTQFIMMDTTAGTSGKYAVASVRHDLSEAQHVLRQEPFLKRPFGIHRAFYQGFPAKYLRHLSLPQSLALILHTVYPIRFDVLYKVLRNGVGTPLMARLTGGQEAHMIGPLGYPFNVRHLWDEGVRHVHVIGGGVGMAPLVFLVQALRYYSFSIKAFVGIESVQAMKYKRDLDQQFEEKPGGAYVYIDDLLDAGVLGTDIHISFDKGVPKRIPRGIPKANVSEGFVSEQYKRGVATAADSTAGSHNSSTMVIACGPFPMMKAIWKTVETTGMRMKMLMEKRMACGIGVCLSCVCKTRNMDGQEEYSRVCTEGPLFDAGSIVWNENDN